MRGDNALLAVTTTEDEITGETKPLFAFPVQVCAAVDSQEPRFDVAAPSGAPRKQTYVDEATGEIIEDDNCPRGVRIGDEFHAISPLAIEEIKDATKLSTMIALGVLNLDEIPFERATGTYFLQSPTKGGTPKAYRLVYEALREQRKGKAVTRQARAIVTKRTARSRQRLCVIYADEHLECLVLVDLRFASQLREPDEQVRAPMTAHVEQKQIDTASKVIDQLGDGALALESETDEALTLRQELIEQALAGEAIAAPAKIADTATTDNLEALLEASLAQ